jgi:hypothetical protein
MNTNRYPQIVQRNTKLIETNTWMGKCKFSLGRAEVWCNEGSFAHEMGHATAWILGINEELGKLVKAQPGALIETNDNPFCYGAQMLAWHQYETAIAEYAADAIMYYYEDPTQLPVPVMDYLKTKLG